MAYLCLVRSNAHDSRSINQWLFGCDGCWLEIIELLQTPVLSKLLFVLSKLQDIECSKPRGQNILNGGASEDNSSKVCLRFVRGVNNGTGVALVEVYGLN